MVTNKERGFTGHPRLQELLDAWFSPKRFESETFYERLGVLFIKRYVPTGGDFFIRRYGIRIAHIRVLQRYNRLRVCAVIRRMRARQRNA